MESDFSTYQAVAVGAASDGSDSDEIPFGERGPGGTVHIPADSPITTLTWLSSHKQGGGYVPAKHPVDATATPIVYVATVQTVAASGAYPIPSHLAHSAALKATGNADGAIDISFRNIRW